MAFKYDHILKENSTQLSLGLISVTIVIIFI